MLVDHRINFNSTNSTVNTRNILDERRTDTWNLIENIDVPVSVGTVDESDQGVILNVV